jgi:hypothetical protein
MDETDILHREQLKNAGFVQQDDYNFIKGDFFVAMYHNTIFVNKVLYDEDNEPTRYISALISSDKGFESYKYRDIPVKKVVDWLCNDLTKFEMKVENYFLTKSLEALD